MIRSKVEVKMVRQYVDIIMAIHFANILA